MHLKALVPAAAMLVCGSLFIPSSTATTAGFGYVTPPTPLPGTIFPIKVGTTLTFDIVLADPDPNGAIGFAFFTLPPGATLNPPSPVVVFGDGITPPVLKTTFSWTPTAAQIGTYFGSYDAANLQDIRLPGVFEFDVFGDLGKYVTYTQGGWGAKPAGNNPGMFLSKNFASVFPNGVEIGVPGAGGTSLRFTSADAIEKFLPSGGTPGVIGVDGVNPKSANGGGSFAGQVLALQLSVAFSAAGKTNTGLGDLKFYNTGNPQLDGKTISDVLDAANIAIGGGPILLGLSSISALNDLLTKINEGFDEGNSNGWVKSVLHS